MSFITKWLARQADLDFQTKRADWLDGQIAHLETRLQLTEKALIDERKAKDKFVLRHSDMMSQKAGLVPAFIKDAEPKEPHKPNPEEEDRIHSMAEMQRTADIDEGLEPYPIEWYENKLRENPEQYLI